MAKVPLCIWVLQWSRAPPLLTVSAILYFAILDTQKIRPPPTPTPTPEKIVTTGCQRGWGGIEKYWSQNHTLQIPIFWGLKQTLFTQFLVIKNVIISRSQRWQKSKVNKSFLSCGQGGVNWFVTQAGITLHA